MEILLNWDDFKNIVEKKQLFVQYCEQTVPTVSGNDTQYIIWVEDGNITFRTEIIKDAENCSIEGIDKQAEAAREQEFNDLYMSDINRPINLSNSSTRSQFIGKKIILSAEETSKSIEWEFEDPVYISKALPIVYNAEWGDYIDLTIHVKANDAEVAFYGKEVYLFQDQPQKWFKGHGAGKLFPFLKLRCTYHKAAGSERKFIIITEFLV